MASLAVGFAGDVCGWHDVPDHGVGMLEVGDHGWGRTSAVLVHGVRHIGKGVSDGCGLVLVRGLAHLCFLQSAGSELLGNCKTWEWRC